MTEQPYSKRELDYFFENIAAQIKEGNSNMEKYLVRIEAQTIKTNGRVNNLEWWKQWITGGAGVVTLVVVPLFGYMLYRVANIPETVQVGIDQALAKYEVRVTK